MKCLRPNRRGFTLIEMLVVVAIIGIMAGIGVPSFVALIQNHRTRSSAMTLLSAIRRTRSRAISLNRELKMTLNVDNTNRSYTYTVTRSYYAIYDPLSIALGSPAKLWEEDAETLETDVPFNVNDGLEHVNPLGTYSFIFNPSGTIALYTHTATATTLSIELEGRRRQYEILIYKAGQISFRVKAT